MKIRTDFVTNSSSSSFIAAAIETIDNELLQFVQDIENMNCLPINIRRSCIELEDSESAYGFDFNVDLRNPNEVISALLDCIEESMAHRGTGNTAAVAKLQELKNRKNQLAESISSYKITVGEEGNSSDAECLCEEYISNLIEDDEDYDDAWEAFLESDGWCKKRETYCYSKGEKEPITTYTEFEGPLDGGW